MTVAGCGPPEAQAEEDPAWLFAEWLSDNPQVFWAATGDKLGGTYETNSDDMDMAVEVTLFRDGSTGTAAVTCDNARGRYDAHHEGSAQIPKGYDILTNSVLGWSGTIEGWLINGSSMESLLVSNTEKKASATVAVLMTFLKSPLEDSETGCTFADLGI